MAYTFGDLKTKLQTQVGDPNLTDSIAGDALVYAEQDVFNKFELTLNSATQTNSITSGTNTLATALPADFQRTVDLVITSPQAQAGSIKDYFLSSRQFRARYPTVIQTSIPSWWTYWTSFEFSVLANQTYTVKLYYCKSVPILSLTTDVPTIPQAFEEMLVLGAKIRVYEQKEDFDYASQFYNRYADALESFINRYSVQQVDVQVQVPTGRQRVGPRVN